MMSKNSFLGSMFENGKRRIWVFAVNILLLTLYFPLGSAIGFSNIVSNAGREQLGEAWKLLQLEKAAVSLFGANEGMVIIASLLAVLGALQAFCYLNNRRKMDLYESVPVSRNRRFWVIYLNGVIGFLVPYLVLLGLGLVVAATYGVMGASLVIAALYGVLISTIVFLGVYNLTILAVMLTGNLLSNILGILVFLFYEILVRLSINGFMYNFFTTYSWKSSQGMETPKLMIPALVIDGIASASKDYSMELVSKVWGVMAKPVGDALLLTVLNLVLAYLAYRKRPTEAAGRSMAFSFIKPVIKIALIILGSVFVSNLIKSFTDGGVFFSVLGLLIGCLLSGGIVQIIFELDFRAFFHKAGQFGIGAVLSVLVFAVFYFDWIGYDSYVPKEDKVESCAVILEDSMNNSYMDKNGEYINSDDYILNNMKLLNVKDVNELMKQRSDKTDERASGYATILWRMKNGKKVYREICFDYEKAGEAMSNIICSEEYKENVYQIYEDEIFQEAYDIRADYLNGFTDVELKDADIGQLRQAYIKDMEQYNYSTVSQIPVGRLDIALTKKEKNGNIYSNTMSCPVYEGFSNTEVFFQSLGVEFKVRPEDVDISRVQIEKIAYRDDYVNDGYEGEKAAEAPGEADTSNQMEVTDPEKIKELLNVVYQPYLSNHFWKQDLIEEGYQITVFYTGKNQIKNKLVYTTDNVEDVYYFKSGQVPGWVTEKLP